MPQKKDYSSYTDALDDLQVFVRKHIKVENEKDELLNYLEECRKSKMVSFRYIYEEIMKYRKEHSDYSKFSDEERKMIDDLFHFWG